MIFLAKHSLCDAHACLCAFLILQNSNRNIEEDIVAMEEIIHTACDKTIPNYRKSTTRKPTGKSIWNNNIAEATKNAKIKYNQWRNAGIPKGRANQILFKIRVGKILEVFLPQSQDVFMSFCYLVVVLKNSSMLYVYRSLSSNNIAEATKNAKIKYNQWRNAGIPKGRANPLKSQLMVAKRLLGHIFPILFSLWWFLVYRLFLPIFFLFELSLEHDQTYFWDPYP
jgi:signal recognition particle subunit SEC65